MNWDDLRILESCARNGSFAKASVELGMSHSSISRRMTQLENDLNISLLHRNPTGVTLTKAGLSIAAQAGDMAASALAIRNTTDEATELSGRIRFETIDASAFNLMPYFQEFSRLHPNVEIDLSLNQGLVDLDRGDADVVLRATNTPPEDYIGHHVATHKFGIFATSELLNRYPSGTPLSELPWVLWGMGTGQAWMAEHTLTPRTSMQVNTAYGMVQAVRAGLGVAHLACWSAANDDNFLCLRAPDGKIAIQIWLLAHKSMRRNARVKALMRFLRKKIVANQALIEGRRGSPTRALNIPIS